MAYPTNNTMGPSVYEMPAIIRVSEPLKCCDGAWEAAYLRFETPEEEQKKFLKRLKSLGAQTWDLESKIVEIFCGRGNGLHACAQLGFKRLEGIDLSEELLAQYRGPATLYVCDCRSLPFDDNSRDVVLVQGGLHHLLELPADLEAVLREVWRVLRIGGRFVVVEPWLTPFLKLVHAICRMPYARRASRRIDALAIMIEQERATYEAWLNRPHVVQSLLKKHFVQEMEQISWGKMFYVGTKQARNQNQCD